MTDTGDRETPNGIAQSKGYGHPLRGSHAQIDVPLHLVHGWVSVGGDSVVGIHESVARL